MPQAKVARKAGTQRSRFPPCCDLLIAKRYVDCLKTLGVETRLKCDSRVDRQSTDVVAHDAALVHEKIIRAVIRDDPTVPIVSIEISNDSVFQKETPPKPDERRSERRLYYPDSISTLGLIVLL
jgi:hypothetical protein